MLTSNNFTVQIAQGGRIVIPAKARQALGLAEGSRVNLEVQEGRLSIVPLGQALDAFLDKTKNLLRGASLSRELITERHQEAARE